MRERDFVLGANLLADDNFADIIKFVSILIECIHITIQWLELWPTRDGHIQRFCSEE
jgi:hypothetical protein